MENKAILMSIRPQYVAKILNGEKTIEIRKKFPKDYVGWVYIYCTKDNKEGLHIVKDKWVCIKHNKVLKECCYNGIVVGRFWCDKVEEITAYPFEAPEHPRGYQVGYDTPTIEWDKLCNLSCLSRDELFDYLAVKNIRNGGYAIHITKLEVFDKPREISEFYTKNLYTNVNDMFTDEKQLEDGSWIRPLKKAPQSWQFIEGK